MTDDAEQGPDPNDVRRHAKKMLTEFEYRQKYRRIDFYRPNRQQIAFHHLTTREKMLRAGNQLGKTHAVGAEMTMHALSLYPEWYAGRRYIVPPAIERPYDFIGWAGCTSQGKTRDGIQLKLLGPIRDHGGMGTGLIPLDNIVGRPTMSRGTSDFVDTIALRRETGGNAIIRQKTYEQGREGWQGEPVDVTWLDEDLGTDAGRQNIYGECLARLTTTGGQILISMSPLPGATLMRKRFKQKISGTGEVVMTVDDCLTSNGGHIPDARLPELMIQYSDAERQTRLYGADMQGEGAVFDEPVERIKHRRDPATFPPYWKWLWAVDFRHSGSATTGHPFAAVLGCRDLDNDVIYIVHAVRMLGLAVNHVAAMKEHPMRLAPVAWPHDGGRAGGILSGETVKAIYKRLGLNMRPIHATFPDGGYNFQAGITEMQNRFARGGLLVADHLHEFFDEYLGYHSINGLVNKTDDDLLSAARVLCMDIRFAKPVEGFRDYAALRGIAPGLAAGRDFDVFTGM